MYVLYLLCVENLRAKSCSRSTNSSSNKIKTNTHLLIVLKGKTHFPFRRSTNRLPFFRSSTFETHRTRSPQQKLHIIKPSYEFVAQDEIKLTGSKCPK